MPRRTGSRKIGRRQRKTRRRQRGGASIGIVNPNLAAWITTVKEAIASNTDWANIPFGENAWPKMNTDTLKETMTTVGDTPTDEFTVENYISVAEVDSIATESEKKSVTTGAAYSELLRKYDDPEYGAKLENIVNIENTLRNALNDPENYKDVTTKTITTTSPLLLWFFINGGKGTPKILFESVQLSKDSSAPPALPAE